MPSDPDPIDPGRSQINQRLMASIEIVEMFQSHHIMVIYPGSWTVNIRVIYLNKEMKSQISQRSIRKSNDEKNTVI